MYGVLKASKHYSIFTGGTTTLAERSFCEVLIFILWLIDINFHQ